MAENGPDRIQVNSSVAVDQILSLKGRNNKQEFKGKGRPQQHLVGISEIREPRRTKLTRMGRESCRKKVRLPRKESEKLVKRYNKQQASFQSQETLFVFFSVTS